MDEKSRRRRRDIPEPRREWVDDVVRVARRDRAIRAVVRLYDRVVPLLFALFVAAPIGLGILPFFVPEFIRNAQRRKRYEAVPSPSPAERIPTSKPIG